MKKQKKAEPKTTEALLSEISDTLKRMLEVQEAVASYQTGQTITTGGKK